MKLLHKITLLFLVLLGIVSCIKSIYEPDIWWQIATGNWILENGQVPTTDIFSYTYAGDPWINVKWGSEVIMALIAENAGVEFLPLLQAVVTLLMGFFLYKTSQLFASKSFSKETFVTAFGVMGVLFLFLINYRLNGRPEMFSHLFTAILLYLLAKFYQSNSSFIFWMIPLQIVWTNMHEAYGVGMVVSVLFTLSLWIEHLLFSKKNVSGDAKSPIQLTLATLLSILAVGINPQGMKMILHPFNLLGQLNENKYTEELISFTTEGYWRFQSIGMVILLLLFVVILIKKGKGTIFQKPSSLFGLAPTLVVFAFFYLSLTSFRNIPFFLIGLFPLMTWIICSRLSSVNKLNLWTKGLLGIQVIFYLSLVSGVYYSHFLPQEKYGLQVRAEMNPTGVSKFIKEQNIQGKGFVDYLSSSYLIYHNPGFKSYIDLRDLDVFPTNFFDNVFFLYQNPTMPIQGGGTPWSFADSVDNFSYVVTLNNPQFRQFNQFLFHENQEFELIYADNLNSLFVRKTEDHQQLIESFGFKPDKAIFRQTTIPETSPLATRLSQLFSWGYQPESAKEFATQAQSNAYYQYLGIQFVN